MSSSEDEEYVKIGARVYGFLHQQRAVEPNMQESFGITVEHIKSDPNLSKDFEEGVEAGKEHDKMSGGRSNPVNKKEELDK